MYMDKATEAIAHFIGLFEITLEQARLRKAYEEFQALRAWQKDAPDLPKYVIKTNAPHEFVGYDPHLAYTPLPPELVWTIPWSNVTYTFRDFFMAGQEPGVVYPGFLVPGTSFGAARLLSPTVEPPGSVAAYIIQAASLSDNDYVGAAGKGVFFDRVIETGAKLASLFDAATDLSPFSGMDMDEPGSSEELIAFIERTADVLRSLSEESEGEADVFLKKGNVIEGSFVNGAAADEVPDIDDYLPSEEDEEEEGEEPTSSFDRGGKDGADGIATAEDGADGSADGADPTQIGEPPLDSAAAALAFEPGKGSVTVAASVELEAGDNMLLNTVSISNNWLTSPVFAVMGDSVEINAIIQINVWSDSDLVGSALAAWNFGADTQTQGFNIAALQRIDLSDDEEDPASPSDGFPKDWVVTEITGDLLLVNWIEQFGFMTDGDVSILSASGVKLAVGTGGNIMVNETTISELGYYYDLIIVGGGIYDANIVHQTNVLLDDDLIGAVEGFQTTGAGSVSTGGNLLWNQASIINVGGADDFQALPEHYRKAGESLKDGKKNLPDDVLHDAAFAGLGALRVLYISGDYVNLHYVKQTNVLGDSDQVALAMNAMAAHPEAQWTVSTGSNALVNFAGIVDLDANGMTYVGGGRYSDEILIQAELISADPLHGQNADALVNEAVAFLDEDMLADTGLPQGQHGLLLPDASQADVMQSMLA